MGMGMGMGTGRVAAHTFDGRPGGHCYKFAAHVLLGSTRAAKLPRSSHARGPACGANLSSHWRYPTSDLTAVSRPSQLPWARRIAVSLHSR